MGSRLASYLHALPLFTCSTSGIAFDRRIILIDRMNSSKRLLLAVCLIFPLAGFAESDPAAVQKQQQDIERRERRENQKIEQTEEQERIKLRTRERDELAKIQREATVTAGTTTAAVVASGSMSAIDPAKFVQYKFAEDEVHNLINNQLTPEMDAKFQKEHNAINRKYAMERARLEAQQIDAGDDTAKQKTQAEKTADLNAKYQEQSDDLAIELSLEEAKLRFTHTSKLNAAERDMAAMVAKHLFAQASKGAAAAYNPAADPEYVKLAAARDAAKSEMETALDELRAKFNVRRTDIDNAKEDELAKQNG